MSEPTTVGPRHDPREVEASLRDEVESLARIVDQQERTIASLNREVDLHARGIGWRLQRRLAPLGAWMLRVPIARQIYRTFYRALEIWVDEVFLKIFSRTGHKVGLALRGRNPLVEGYDRRPPPIEDQYAQWITVHGAPPDASAMQAAIASFRVRPLVSVLAQVSDETATALQISIATLEAQSYAQWEVCVAPSWAEAFRQAKGDYIAFLEAGDSLVELYPAEKDPAIRRQIVNSLFTQGNATALVALARKEPDINMKKEMVQKLSMMDSPVARNYMLELLK
jgi:hypothetical protein